MRKSGKITIDCECVRVRVSACVFHFIHTIKQQSAQFFFLCPTFVVQLIVPTHQRIDLNTHREKNAAQSNEKKATKPILILFFSLLFNTQNDENTSQQFNWRRARERERKSSANKNAFTRN